MPALDPIWMAHTQQAQFRFLLDAMARPGRRYPLSSICEQGPAVLGILATLLDAQVSLADPHALLREQDWPMLQAKSAVAEQADYLVCDARRAPDFTPKLGSLCSPEQSATLILVVESLDQGDVSLRLTGPGIAQSERLQVCGLHRQWLEKRADWVCAFPLGVDFILLDNKQACALPRTTTVQVS